jgi:hypothetical protein
MGRKRGGRGRDLEAERSERTHGFVELSQSPACPIASRPPAGSSSACLSKSRNSSGRVRYGSARRTLSLRSYSVRGSLLNHFRVFDGVRTRARTLDPLIKRNRVMRGGMEARAALADLTAQGGREARNRKGHGVLPRVFDRRSQSRLTPLRTIVAERLSGAICSVPALSSLKSPWRDGRGTRRVCPCQLNAASARRQSPTSAEGRSD